MSNQDLAIKLVGVSKTYQLHHEKPTLAENIVRKNKREMFTALKNVNLEIKKGEKIGMVGSNGSGKTTLLKIISGISTPTKGLVKTWGKVVSLIDLSAGFHPELTGRENVFLNGLLIGMGREEVRAKYGQITNFADIGEFIGAPMYTYSSGMKLRLGFSIAVAADPDILILDEGTAVGDEDFQHKSSQKIDEFFKQKKTIILVSHWMDYVREHCQKVVLMKNGELVMFGKTDRVIGYYLDQIDSGK